MKKTDGRMYNNGNNLSKVILRAEKKIFCLKIQIQRFIEILYYINLLRSSILLSLDCNAIVNIFSTYLSQNLLVNTTQITTQKMKFSIKDSFSK